MSVPYANTSVAARRGAAGAREGSLDHAVGDRASRRGWAPPCARGPRLRGGNGSRRPPPGPRRPPPPRARLLRLGKLLQGGERARRVDRDPARVHEADASGAVHDERHAAREVPRVGPRAVEPAHPPGRTPVAEEAERQAERRRPGEVAFGGIGGDPDDLGVERGELGVVVPEPGELQLSAAGERLDEEGDHDEVAPRERLREAEGPAVLIAEHDVRRAVADGERRVALGRARDGRHERRERQQDERSQGALTAWSTAPRKSFSGTAPSNWTRSLMTTFGTPITWQERASHGNSVA